MMKNQLKFSRLEKVIGSDNVNDLSKKSVLVLGVGGVGGYVVESLARSNIGTLILVDYDKVEESNINRQIIALNSTIGKSKVDVLEERIKDINSGCKVIKIDKFIDDNNYLELFDNNIDYFVDACDTVLVKKLVITDIRKTVNDPLARILRKFVRDEKINKKVMVLTSSELPIKTGDRTPGSTAFVPSSAGLLIASYIVRSFIKK